MLEQAREIRRQLSDWRRDFHMHPELGFKEMRTSRIVAEALEALGYRVRREVGGTGVVADLGSGSPCVALRADMDALPIQETNDAPYASRVPGVMHACGHDAHTAMALGAAALLAREKFPGSVRFLFQPSEEVGDSEGVSGAPRMVQAGAMQGVDMVLGLHVDASAPVGAIRVDSGPVSGGVDSWFGRILGRGGHGAKPHESIDPIYLAAHVILALNAIVSRRLDPFDAAVVSIGSLRGGETENVIPEHVDLTGTLRFTDIGVREQIHAEIRRAFEIVRPLGGDCDLRIETGSLPVVNHPDAVRLIRACGADLLGAQNVLPMVKDLGAEDFGSFSEIAPGAMFGLGTLIDGDERFGHNPRFDIDENALPIGTAMLVEVALRYLRQAEAK